MRTVMMVMFFIITFSTFLVLVYIGCGKGYYSKTPETGEQLYNEYCQPCHGTDGRGEGPLSYLVYPKPRNFTAGLYKLRSTREDQLPSDEDLFRTIRAGMMGTSMPAFSFLSDAEIESLVGYIKIFDSGFEEEERSPIIIPDRLPYTSALASRGKQAYTELGCIRCHGETGRGDGPSAFDLKDAWGYPIYVRDFTRGNYLGGYQPEDLYLRFIAGMGGTPMPSYESSLSYLAETKEELQEVLWGLIYYVKDLESEQARELRVTPPKDGTIKVGYTDEFVFEKASADPFDPQWSKAEEYHIPVSRIWQTINDDAGFISVKALYTESRIAVQLVWQDRSQNTGGYRVQEFQDAAAVQFSLTPEPGFHGMGSRTNPVDMWFWKAAWQMYVEKQKTSDIALAYNRRASDAATDDFPDIIGEELFLAGRQAGNLLSRDSLFTSVESINSVGPETITSKSADKQAIHGTGKWDGELWRVVFVRDLVVDDETAVRFNTTDTYWLSFAVWDGSAGDRDGLKKVSTWYRLIFD
jgi:mono/diheme cytochrome c family protein